MKNQEQEKILDSIQSQISSFDNKASILLTAVGIIFALTLSFLDVFHSDFFTDKSLVFRVFYIILFILYILQTVMIIVSLILVILPRNHSDNKKYPNYYGDIPELSKQELRNKIKEFSEKDDLILDQILINSNICRKKSKYLKFSLITFVVSIICISTILLMTILS